MAEETMLEKAMALLPGAGPKKRAKPKTHQQKLAAVQKSLATLAKDVKKLAGMMGKPAKKAAPAKKPAARKLAARKTPARKTGRAKR